MGVRPLHDWILVDLDPIPETSVQGIILVGAGAQRVRTGTVKRAGPGRRRHNGTLVPMSVECGEKVAFFRENLEHQQGKSITAIVQELEENTGLIREPDVLVAFAPGEKVDFR
jgi:co-chaperonin GroES (HSP10)